MLTGPKVAGAGIILVGVCMCVIGAATNVQTEFTPSDVEWRVAQPVGGIYVVFLCGALFASVVAILMFETSYPNVKHPVVPADGSAEAVKLSPKEIQESDKNPDVLQAPEVHAEVRPPPLHLNAIMAVVYPASLGLDEGVCHLTMKSAISMIANCSSDDSCGHWILYMFTVVWIAASVATVWWLRVVFSRYETTLALPVEYGTVNLCSVCSGLIFYGESRFMSSWQLMLNIAGLATVLVGISVGRLITCKENAQVQGSHETGSGHQVVGVNET